MGTTTVFFQHLNVFLLGKQAFTLPQISLQLDLSVCECLSLMKNNETAIDIPYFAEFSLAMPFQWRYLSLFSGFENPLFLCTN